MELGTVRQAVERELNISKGLQGIVVAGAFRSVKSHLKIAWADTVEEARLCFCRGAVRNKDRWAFIQPMRRSEDLSFLFQCDLRTWQLAAERSLHVTAHAVAHAILLATPWSCLLMVFCTCSLLCVEISAQQRNW